MTTKSGKLEKAIVRTAKKAKKAVAGWQLPAVTKRQKMLKRLHDADRSTKRKNPDEEAAAALSEAFHGRPAKEIRDYEETWLERRVLADLGKLIELRVWLDEDDYIGFSPKGVRVAASDDGGQIYFVGGDQALDLAALGLDRALPKDHLEIGPCDYIAYFTSKKFHDFEPSVYEHQLGEESGNVPTLNYDVLNQRFYLTGGNYQILPAGITD